MTSCMAIYHLRPLTSFLIHRNSQSLFVGDYDEPCICHGDLEAQIRSGDYFIMLATTLDQLGKESEEYQTKEALEDIVSDLIHLHDNYTINAKEKQAE